MFEKRETMGGRRRAIEGQMMSRRQEHTTIWRGKNKKAQSTKGGQNGKDETMEAGGKGGRSKSPRTPQKIMRVSDEEEGQGWVWEKGREKTSE